MALYDLYGATVVITGASGGFGSELTKQLIGKFACSVIGIGRTREKMEALADSLGGKKRYFRYYIFDVSEKENWQSLAHTFSVKSLVPDILINNAGIMPPLRKFECEDSETAKKVMETNYMAAVYSCEALLPLIKLSRRGAVVNVASSAAFSPVAGTAVYSASKGALKNFTQALSEELDGQVFVSLVCPGFSDTELFRETYLSEKDREIMKDLGTDKAEIAKQMIEGILLKKKLICPGKDSKLMTAISNAAPAYANTLYSKIMKSSDLNIFGDLQ